MVKYSKAKIAEIEKTKGKLRALLPLPLRDLGLLRKELHLRGEQVDLPVQLHEGGLSLSCDGE